MLVDDDEDDQMIFTEVLSTTSENIGCKAFSNGNDAISFLQASHEKPGVIFLDINMPIINGFQCLAKIKKNKELSAIPVIMYSTSDDQHAKDTAMLIGATEFLTKPSDHLLLKRELQKIIEKYFS